MESEFFGNAFNLDEEDFVDKAEGDEESSAIDLDNDYEFMNDNYGDMLPSFNEAFFSSDSKSSTPTGIPLPKEETKHNVSAEDEKKKDEAKKEMVK